MVFAAGSIFDPVYNFFGTILAFFYGLVPNLGVSIILLTVVVMLALFPLTAKQAKAMMHMQRAQPEIKKLQAKYKNDRAKLNEEVMKFYQENKINPLAGCLPLLVQMPIFLALFRVMREPYKYIPAGSTCYAAFCSGQRCCTQGVRRPRARGCRTTSQLPRDGPLAERDRRVGGGFLNALPYFILVGLVIVTAFAQSRQSRRNAPNMTSQMAMISTVLPIAFGLFSLQFPAGLVLYFLVSNLWRLGQQELIMRRITNPIKAQGPIEVKGAEKSKGVIEVEEAPPAPKAAGGLRKLFQPAAPPAIEAESDADVTEPSGNGAAKQPTTPNAKKPAAKPAASKPAASTRAAKPTTASSATTRKQNSQQAAARRKSNKRRKRR